MQTSTCERMQPKTFEVEGKPVLQSFVVDNTSRDLYGNFDGRFYPYVGLNPIEVETFHEWQPTGIKGLSPFLEINFLHERVKERLGYGIIGEEVVYRTYYKASSTYSSLYYSNRSSYPAEIESHSKIFDPVMAYRRFKIIEGSPVVGIDNVAKALANIKDGSTVKETIKESWNALEGIVPPNLDYVVSTLTELNIPFTLQSLRPAIEKGLYTPSEIVDQTLQDERQNKRPFVSKIWGAAAIIAPIAVAATLDYLSTQAGVDLKQHSAHLITEAAAAGLGSLGIYRAWKARQNLPAMWRYFDSKEDTNLVESRLGAGEILATALPAAFSFIPILLALTFVSTNEGAFTQILPSLESRGITEMLLSFGYFRSLGGIFFNPSYQKSTQSERPNPVSE